MQTLATRTVLVVDEDGEAESAKAALGCCPYRVLTAQDGAGALDVLRSQQPVELVASADPLPGELSGAALIGRVRIEYPGTAVMLIVSPQAAPAQAGVPRLFRPYGAAALIEMVESLMREQRHTAQSIAAAMAQNRAARVDLETAADALRETVRRSQGDRTRRYRERLREPGVCVPTILVVEDEPAIRYAVCRFLDRVGFRVLAAAEGSESLRVSREHPGRIDLLLTDLGMPGMNGVEVAAALTAARPGMRVIVMSAAGTECGLATLHKPFELDQLLAAIVSKLLNR